MHNKRGFLLIATTVLTLAFFVQLNGQTASKTTTKSTSGRSSTTFRDKKEDEKRRGAARDFIMAVIGGMLRHPDPAVRKQTIQSISRGMISGEGTSNRSNSEKGGIRSLFAMGYDNNSGGSRDDETSTGVGGAVFIPDLYVLLSDPDPEVRDIAAVGLDMIFQTETTLLRFMNDPEPLIRKYATQIYSKKGFLFSNNERSSRSDNEDMSQVSDLLALRTMLVHLKYEKEPGVRKAIVDSIDWYIRSGGSEQDGRSGSNNQFAGDMFGVDVALLTKYLNDENPELRKQAIKTIALREVSDDVLMKLMERYRVEDDEAVKKELMTALDTIRAVQYYKRERDGRGGAGGSLPSRVLPGADR